jgi:serine/threonine protein kinase
LALFRSSRSSPDNYRIIKPIAKGGMSVVYEGVRKADDMPVAIKIITPEFTQLSEKLEEIFDKGSEGEIALSLRHPNVVRTIEFGHKGREYYIVMEFIDGPNLKQLIDSGSPRWSEHRFRIAVEAGRGLAYIHKNGLIHRDYCPKNILLAEDGTVKLIDFGLAIPAHLREKWRWDRSGTAAYMAPEQIRGQKVDIRTDVYAYAASIYEIMTGNRPYPDDPDKYKKMAVHLNIDPANPRQYNRSIPVALEHIMLKGMARDADDRFPTVDAMLREIITLGARYYGGRRDEESEKSPMDMDTL